MRFLATTCLILLAISCLAPAQSTKLPVKPGKIFIGSFGMGDDAEQLRLALGYELTHAGFKVVDYQQQANSTISGLIVTRLENGKPAKRVTVFLNDPTGKMIWNQDFGSASMSAKSSGDNIRQRAEEIAKLLKRDASPRKGAPAPSAMKKSPAK